MKKSELKQLIREVINSDIQAKVWWNSASGKSREIILKFAKCDTEDSAKKWSLLDQKTRNILSDPSVFHKMDETKKK